MEKTNIPMNVDTFKLHDNGSVKSVAKIVSGEDPKKKSLEVISGDWNPSDSRFIVDEEGVRYTLLTQEATANLVAHLKTLQNENFELKLEKAILQQMPIDYEDVLLVTSKKIENEYLKKGKHPQSINLEKLLLGIRKEHPNLFYNFEDLIKKPHFEHD